MRGLSDVGPHDDLSYTGTASTTQYTQGAIMPNGTLVPYPSKFELPATIGGVSTKTVLIGLLAAIIVYFVTRSK